MFSSPRPLRSHYTLLSALILIALVFSPAAVVVLRPVSYFSLSMAVALSAASLFFAWAEWRKTELGVPSIAASPLKAK